MARYRRSDGHYGDVECADAEPERYLVLSCNEGAATKKKKAADFSAQVALRLIEFDSRGLLVQWPSWSHS